MRNRSPIENLSTKTRRKKKHREENKINSNKWIHFQMLFLWVHLNYMPFVDRGNSIELILWKARNKIWSFSVVLRAGLFSKPFRLLSPMFYRHDFVDAPVTPYPLGDRCNMGRYHCLLSNLSYWLEDCWRHSTIQPHSYSIRSLSVISSFVPLFLILGISTVMANKENSGIIFESKKIHFLNYILFPSTTISYRISPTCCLKNTKVKSIYSKGSR